MFSMLTERRPGGPTRPSQKRSEYIILSLEVGKWAGDIAKATLPDNLYVDYVRVYQKNTAERVNVGIKPVRGSE